MHACARAAGPPLPCQRHSQKGYWYHLSLPFYDNQCSMAEIGKSTSGNSSIVHEWDPLCGLWCSGGAADRGELPGGVQLLHLCLWPDGQRQDPHHDRRNPGPRPGAFLCTCSDVWVQRNRECIARLWQTNWPRNSPCMSCACRCVPANLPICCCLHSRAALLGVLCHVELANLFCRGGWRRGCLSTCSGA